MEPANRSHPIGGVAYMSTDPYICVHIVSHAHVLSLSLSLAVAFSLLLSDQTDILQKSPIKETIFCKRDPQFSCTCIRHPSLSLPPSLVLSLFLAFSLSLSLSLHRLCTHAHINTNMYDCSSWFSRHAVLISCCVDVMLCWCHAVVVSRLNGVEILPKVSTLTNYTGTPRCWHPAECWHVYVYNLCEYVYTYILCEYRLTHICMHTQKKNLQTSKMYICQKRSHSALVNTKLVALSRSHAVAVGEGQGDVGGDIRGGDKGEEGGDALSILTQFRPVTPDCSSLHYSQVPSPPGSPMTLRNMLCVLRNTHVSISYTNSVC